MPTSPSSDRGALAAAPAAGHGRGATAAQLKFFYGPMDCGKSTLALQIDHNHSRQGRSGLVFTRYDRSGGALLTTRVGLKQEAIEVTDDLDFLDVIRRRWAAGNRVDYVIVDEAGFLNPEHVDQLAYLVDIHGVDAYCFGLMTDFRSQLLPGAKRLVELADELAPVQVEVLCWCGRPGKQNARVVGEQVVREGATVVVADTDLSAADGSPEPHDPVRYQVLCRAHFLAGDLGGSGARGQLVLP